MKKANPVLLVALVVLVGWLFFESRARQTAIAAEAEDRTENAKLRQALAGVLAANQILRAEVAALRSAPSIPSKRDTIKEPAQWSLVSMGTLSEMAGNPATVPMLLEYFRAQQNRKYAALFSALRLSGETLEALRSLLTERAAIRYDLADFRMQGSNVAAIQRDRDVEFMEKLTALVGADKARLLAEADRNVLIWDKVQKLDSRLIYEASALDENQLAALMNDWKGVPVNRGETEEEAIAAILGRNESLLKKSSGYLSPAQLRTLSSFMESELWSQKFELRMMRARPPSAKE